VKFFEPRRPNSLLKNSVQLPQGLKPSQKRKTLSQRLKRCATQKRVFQQTVKPRSFRALGRTAEEVAGKRGLSRNDRPQGLKPPLAPHPLPRPWKGRSSAVVHAFPQPLKPCLPNCSLVREILLGQPELQGPLLLPCELYEADAHISALVLPRDFRFGFQA